MLVHGMKNLDGWATCTIDNANKFISWIYATFLMLFLFFRFGNNILESEL